MMRGLITEIDFKIVDECFPGIVRYYRELQEKPATFLELLWGFTHRECAGSETPALAAEPARCAVVR